MTWATNGDMMRDLRAEAYAESCALRAVLPAAVTVPRDPTDVDHYRLNVCCPRCGGPLRHVAASAPSRSLSNDLRAITECPACNDRWLITVHLSSDECTRTRRQGFDRAVDFHMAEAARERELNEWRVSA